MIENRHGWFGHVKRIPIDNLVRRVSQTKRSQTRGRPIIAIT